MTKPAAVFAQLIGAFLAFLSIGMFSDNSGGAWLMLIAGAGLFFAGGASARKKMQNEAKQ